MICNPNNAQLFYLKKLVKYSALVQLKEDISNSNPFKLGRFPPPMECQINETAMKNLLQDRW